eukprot:4688189-Prymnesium_polylepis.3
MGMALQGCRTHVAGARNASPDARALCPGVVLVLAVSRLCSSTPCARVVTRSWYSSAQGEHRQLGIQRTSDEMMKRRGKKTVSTSPHSSCPCPTRGLPLSCPTCSRSRILAPAVSTRSKRHV